jgi:adenylate cyclase
VLSEADLAQLAGCGVEDVRRVVAVGLVHPSPAGEYAPIDAVAVRFVEAVERAGVPVEAIARGVASGDLSFGRLHEFVGVPAPLTSTYADLAAAVGRAVEVVQRLCGALGLPEPEPGSRMRADEEEMLTLLFESWRLVEDDELVALGRVYGENLGRVAESEVQFFHRAVYARLSSGEPSAERVDETEDRALEATTFAKRFVPWLHERHFEHHVIDYVVSNTEAYLDRLGIASRRAAVVPAIAFLDVTGYTALTDERGDEAAAELVAALATVVRRAAGVHGGRPVKWLGDGVMFHFPAAAAAVEGALDLVEHVPEAVAVRARVGVNAGPVVFREGDYFGRTVNVAARIADYARPGEVLVSAAVVAVAEDADRVAYEPIGDIPLRGVPEPVELLRALRREADPPS